MNRKETLRCLKNQFRSLFIDPPASNEALFQNLQRSISLFDPDWVSQRKPSSEETIQHLEEVVQEKFGQTLPPSYRLYLQQMGRDDGGLIPQHLFDLEFWDYFKGEDLAEAAETWIGQWEKSQAIKRRMELCGCFKKSPELPPFWDFFYQALAEEHFAFSPSTQDPDAIMVVAANYTRFYDTFPKLLAYCEYLKVIDWIEAQSEALTQEQWDGIPPSEPDRMFSAFFSVDCPVEWMQAGYLLFCALQEKLEERFSLEEAWFSRGKNYDTFDPEDHLIWGESNHTLLTRYIAVSTTSDLTISLKLYPSTYQPFFWVYLVGRDIKPVKEIMNTVLQETTLVEKSLSYNRMNLEPDAP